MKERLQKIIAVAGLASRREAERWIEEGRITVNGRPASLGDSADPKQDRIEVDGKPLPARRKFHYILLNKPAGYVVSRRDPQGRPVVGDLVKQVPARLFSVGRLDLTTEGLLLMTDDGDLAQRLSHPRHQVEKTYLVRVQGTLSREAERRLEAGIPLADGMTAPAKVSQVRMTTGHTWFELTIREGRNRQVRRMCEAVGHPVSRLKRIRLDFLDLRGVPVGGFRELTAGEIARLKKL
jgi:23S rRNA pseudouridine2605 synthase